MVTAMFAGTDAMSEEDDQHVPGAALLPTARLGQLSATLRAEFGPSEDEATPPALAAAGAALAERLGRSGDAATAGDDADDAPSEAGADTASETGAAAALGGRR
ncbi:hypothetical protein [Oharaeibacter diazotrophicus]|uniref:Uncharacterized protein n=1 Tax=Oharaeibacter diazotrophicus TaxID=1920512 RepID=A0A4R6R8P4_9HYPH|nr:hypothetical protein [Oharaeibacter diazotrophicus]TDP82403.1 hypothetical protein EDD54_3670 [Oharaeibacter diazotrophicus]BBE72834.1 hypothetical protein OHA_1_02433 [Pleomorphomonas sp. SM30]GLS76872.1 hypothetical protein GCM10007904_22090 [Oharaeibacter diazotrophicus]